MMSIFSTAPGEESERKFQFSSNFKQPENTIPYVVSTCVCMCMRLCVFVIYVRVEDKGGEWEKGVKGGSEV